MLKLRILLGAAPLAFMAALAAAADWKPVGSNNGFFSAVIDHQSIQVGQGFLNGNDLVFFNWARIYNEPQQVWKDKPLVKHHIFGVSMGCDPGYMGFGVTSEIYLTVTFDIIQKSESKGAPLLSDDIRNFSDVPGMDDVRKFVCANRQLWRATKVKAER